MWAAGLAALMLLPASSNASLAPTPYMGWNPFYANEGYGNEATLEAVASSLASTGLQAAGYRIVWLDYGWWSGTASRDSTGQLTVDSSQWPDGMKGFTDWLHQHGFLAGIYTDAGSSGCSGQGVGSYGHYQQDADTFVNWGFDAVKVDFCGAGKVLEPEGYTPQELYTQFSQAVAGRMILNVCNFWTPGQIGGGLPTQQWSSWDNYQWAPAVGQSWRTDTDVGSWTGVTFTHVLRNLDQDSTPQAEVQAAGPGHWNDPDYLTPAFLTSTQAQSEFSMWAIAAAPLILGSDPRSLSPSTISMLENSRVIAVDQDSLGAQGHLVSQSSAGQQVWVKPMADGSRAVALFNRGSSAQQITTTASAVGLSSASHYTLLNLWTNQASTTKGKITARVQSDAVVLYRVTVG